MSAMSSSGTSGANDTIVLYNFPLSPCAEKVRFALAAKGLPWRDVDIDLTRKENLSPGYLRLNPNGMVPTLVYREDVISESTVILEYIEDMWATPSLRPSSASGRARMRIWTKHVDEVLHPAWPGIAWPVLVRPAWQQRDRAEVDHMLSSLLEPRRRARQREMFELGLDSQEASASLSVVRATLQRMEDVLAEGAFLAGAELSLADIAVLPYIFVLDVFGTRSSLDGRFPGVSEWYARTLTLPCFGQSLRSLFSPERLDQTAATAARSAFVERFNSALA